MNTYRIFSSAPLPPPFAFTLSGCPSRFDSARPCGMMAGAFRFNRRFGDLKLDVMPVSAGVTCNIILMLFKRASPPPFLRLFCRPSRLHSGLVPLFDLLRSPWAGSGSLLALRKIHNLLCISPQFRCRALLT